MPLNYLPAMWELGLVGAGIVIAIWTPLYLSRRNDKAAALLAKEEAHKAAKIALEKKIEDDKAAAKVLADIEQAKALEVQALKNSIDWLKKQFGAKPNGGGIMEKLDRHIDFTETKFVRIEEAQKETNDKLDENITLSAQTSARLGDHLKLVEAGMIK